MVKLLITDLDDTLYSWIGFFIPSFYEMVDELSEILDKPRNQLLQEYKKVHIEKGNVEFPYATLYLPSVKKAFPEMKREQLLENLNPAFHRFNSRRKKNLQLFPHVKETLEELHSKGVIIVGYTDSSEENGFYRLKKLGIDELFHRVYVSDSQYERPEHIPAAGKTEKVHVKKPNPQLLNEICLQEGINPKDTLYVGDSLTKDIYMAKLAGITAVLCQYTLAEDIEELYAKLVAISHWTEKDFQYEESLKQECCNKNITPDYVIHSFEELKDIVQQKNLDKSS